MKNYCCFLLLLLVAGCKEKFDPPAISIASNYLVVEGVINSGPGPTTFKLSRTVKLGDPAVVKPELRAQVTVEGENNLRYTLPEKSSGTYTINQLSLNNSIKYRLRIRTTDGKEYLSDFVAVKQTPAMDSISWKRTNGGVQIYVNTHYPQNNTRYYRWSYDETWEIHSPYPSYYKYVNNAVVFDLYLKTNQSALTVR